jgi:hypothetical protein
VVRCEIDPRRKLEKAIGESKAQLTFVRLREKQNAKNLFFMEQPLTEPSAYYARS